MKTDICIIGGGLIGCVMAAKLCKSGFKVVILEVASGHFPNESRDIYTNSGDINYSLNSHRVKAIGGTTLVWGAYTPRMLETDFKSKTIYGVGEDWPISYSNLEPYYSWAEKELGVAGNSDDEFASFRSSDFPMPARQIHQDLKSKFEKIGVKICSQPRAFTTKVWNERAPYIRYQAQNIHLPKALATNNLKLITDATVTRLEIDKLGNVKRAVYSGLTDRSEKIQEATLFILAAGGIENPRLLLLSKSEKFQNGLANRSGLVGKYFMEHSQVGLACNFNSPFTLPFRRVLSFQYYNRRKDEDRGAIFLTFAGFPKFDDYVNQNYWGEELRKKILSKTNLTLDITCTVEEIPYIDSYVALDPNVKDIFGNPAPRINFSRHSMTQKSLKIGHKLINKIGQDLNPESIRDRGDMFASHHMGTCRMSSDPSKGVVDSNLVTHDVPNLMVVGSSAYVTSGCVNPGLTSVALALKAVDFIISKYTS